MNEYLYYCPNVQQNFSLSFWRVHAQAYKKKIDYTNFKQIVQITNVNSAKYDVQRRASANINECEPFMTEIYEK